MTIKYRLEESRFIVMQLRARGLPTVRNNVMAKTIETLEANILQMTTTVQLVAQERNEAVQRFKQLLENYTALKDEYNALKGDV